MASRLSVALLLIALIVLAGLQYYWIGQISVAERQRLERSVRESSDEFAEDFALELRTLLSTWDSRDGTPAVSIDDASILTRYQDWVYSAGFPGLVEALYTLRGKQLSRLDPVKGTGEPSDWPPKLLPLAELLEAAPARDGFQNFRPLRLEGMDIVLVPLGRGGDLPPRGDRPQRGAGRSGEPVQSQARQRIPFGQEGVRPNESWLIVELNHDVIVGEVFPALAARRFPQNESRHYRLAVVSTGADTETRVIFNGGSAWTPEDLAAPDHSVALFGPGGFPGGRRRPNGFNALPGWRGGPRVEREARGPFPPVPGALFGEDWTLLVKHQAGSLEIAASRFRDRNLAISFGILVVLGIGAATMIVSGQRARRLGALQMEFAAGVSHELRTPLAVIQSAAHNLRSGVVRDREGIEEYAAIVQKEARRLSEMVEHVMTYTETQSGRQRFDIAPVDVAHAVDHALRNMDIVLRDSNAEVHTRIEDDLPPASADTTALVRCVQNLLSNAVKYGRSSGGVRIDIDAGFNRAGGTVDLSVTDHGKGVPAADLRLLFEPFHRGSNAEPSTPGNGLGLHLVRSMIESQGGTVSYERVDGAGARFTLHLQTAAMPGRGAS